eukprot:9286066-Pyramimonas_sp.AAC.1
MKRGADIGYPWDGMWAGPYLNRTIPGGTEKPGEAGVVDPVSLLGSNAYVVRSAFGDEAAMGRRRRQHSRQTATPAQTTGCDEAATATNNIAARPPRRPKRRAAMRRRRDGDGDNAAARPPRQFSFVEQE